MPNGLTSLVTGSSCSFGGDYIACHVFKDTTSPANSTRSTTNETGAGSMICVEFYWWPLGEIEMVAGFVACRMVVTLSTLDTDSFLDGRVSFERGLVNHDAVVAATAPDLELWSPSNRAKLVDSWEPWLTVGCHYART
ncbi:hypothetical protein GN958_ATG03862 [Phytophthora infestans]|uniref:Uncharacterized protein n=1 Tax=Phytophthora infestans TaxID=4787 RepID=A0A8S9V170_PHYIN|nr:hypothetical protein GN958_ATG03862 [Phytophthora infestans]